MSHPLAERCRRSVRRFLGAASNVVFVFLAAAGCDPSADLPSAPLAQSSATAPDRSGREVEVDSATVRFVDAAAALGLDYVWPVQQRPMTSPDSFGSGCAFFDYDQDGWMDVLCVGDPHVALYRNVRGRRFENVTASCGLAEGAEGNWNGCTFGDYDGNGYPDVLVTGLHCLALFRNGGDGRFEDATPEAALDPANGRHWGASSGFMDLDGDGDLDLVILNYCVFNENVRQHCELSPGVFSGCPPSEYEPEFGEVWRNEGDGTFQFVLEGTDMAATGGKALVIAFSDVGGDGPVDFYIGNDGEEADFLHNLGDMRFKNTGDMSGLAMHNWDSMAAMGADWGDYDRDGLLDLCVSDFSHQNYAIFRNLGNSLFESASDATGISGPTYLPLGFGSKWMEFDNDGFVDLTFANGHVYEQAPEIEKGTTYRQPIMLFHNRAGGNGRTFRDLVPTMAAEISRPLVGRGSATGDFDNDGLMDLLAVDHEGPLMLLHNRTETDHRWIKLDLRGEPPNRFAFGARAIGRSGDEVWINEVSPASSYLSASDPRIHWGLGDVERLDSIAIRWPSGREEVLRDVAGDRILTIVEGRGIVAESKP